MMREGRPVYLDYASTTPVHPAVREAMEPFLGPEFGNPSNLYPLGRRAAAATDAARTQVAAVLGCSDDEIVFTGGGSESDNLAIKGVAFALRSTGKRHLVTTTIEHSAVLGAIRHLEESFDFEVTYVPVGADGIADAKQVVEAIRPDTALVSVMLANNEIGAIQPVAEIAEGARRRGALVHTDAVQGAGYLDLDVGRLGVDLLTLSAHKFYAPKGIGILYVRRGTPLEPLVHGGDQESHRRAGTENVAGIVACGAALAMVEEHRRETSERLGALRDKVIATIEKRVTGALLNGHRSSRLANNVNFCFGDIQGETLLIELELENCFASSGSACHAGSTDPSHVLLAIGRSPDQAHTALRFTLGAPTLESEIDRLLDILPKTIDRLRSKTPARR